MKFFHLILIGFAFSLSTRAVFAGPVLPIDMDTVKYRGYRLELYGFELVKKTDNWIKVRFSAVNTGRMDVDLSHKGREHWVQFNFDRSVFDQKLGGYREHIKYQLAKDGFKLPAGERREKIEVKFPVILPASARPEKREQPVVSAPKAETPLPEPPSQTVFKKAPRNEVPIFAPAENEDIDMPIHPEISGKGSSTEEEVQVPAASEKAAVEKCPDLRFENLRIVKEDGKWATLEYTIVNDGEAAYHLFETGKGRDDGLIIRAYISGVSSLSRGALPIGGQILQPAPGTKSELKKGEKHQARLKLDIRKKTRYMKSLILKLDGAQYAAECDRTNNTAAVVLQ